MKALNFLFMLLAAGIWFLIAIIYTLSIPVAILLAIVIFPFWWIGGRIKMRLLKQ